MEDPNVGFTIKELLGQLGKQLEDMDRKLDTINARMELKAERADVEALRAVIEQIRLVNAQATPLDTKAAVERHLQEPHAISQRHEDRIRSLEKWRYSLPASLGFAVAAIVLAILRHTT